MDESYANQIFTFDNRNPLKNLIVHSLVDNMQLILIISFKPIPWH